MWIKTMLSLSVRVCFIRQRPADTRTSADVRPRGLYTHLTHLTAQSAALPEPTPSSQCLSRCEPQTQDVSVHTCTYDPGPTDTHALHTPNTCVNNKVMISWEFAAPDPLPPGIAVLSSSTSSLTGSFGGLQRWWDAPQGDAINAAGATKLTGQDGV